MTTSLPDDLLRDQLRRVQLLYAAGAVLWSITLLLDIYLSPHGDRGPYAALIEAGAAVLAAGTVVYARFGPGRDRTKIDVGVSLVVAHAIAIALLNSWMPQPLTSRPISGITLLLLLFGMIAPTTPPRILATSLVAACMDPLGVWFAHLRGLPAPPRATSTASTRSWCSSIPTAFARSRPCRCPTLLRRSRRWHARSTAWGWWASR